MKKKYRFLCWTVAYACFCITHTAYAEEKIRIVATTSTLASLVREVAGDKADMYHVAASGRDVHFISPTPRDVLKVKKADVFVHAGLDLEAWRDPLLTAAGNEAFLGESVSAIDTSKGISLLEIPTSLSRADGDIHLHGNPHYGVDPANAKIMVRNIASGLARLYPADRDYFIQNGEAFEKRLDEKIENWSKRLAPFKGAKVMTYHRSWPYFLHAFGLETAGYVEPKAGITPTAKHLAETMRTIREKNVRLIIREPFNEAKTPAKLAEETGIPVITLIQQTGGEKNTDTYLDMMEYNVRTLEAALTQKGEPAHA